MDRHMQLGRPQACFGFDLTRARAQMHHLVPADAMEGSDTSTVGASESRLPVIREPDPQRGRHWRCINVDRTRCYARLAASYHSVPERVDERRGPSLLECINLSAHVHVTGRDSCESTTLID